jgi:hypothetical protein
LAVLTTGISRIGADGAELGFVADKLIAAAESLIARNSRE